MFEFIFNLPKEMFVIAMAGGVVTVLIVLLIAIYQMKREIRNSHLAEETSPFH